MADDTKNATVLNALGGNQSGTVSNAANILDATVEVAAAADANSVYTFFTIPVNARIHGISALYWDDLASTGSPTIDAGITGDDDCLIANQDVTAVASSAVSLISDPANWGKKLYEIAGISEAKYETDIIVTLKDAAANTGGTISICLAPSHARCRSRIHSSGSDEPPFTRALGAVAASSRWSSLLSITKWQSSPWKPKTAAS